MKYTIYYKNPNKHFLELELLVDTIDTDQIFLQLPSWRPGRYEIQNFAKNIQKFRIFDANNQQVSFKKVKKDCWEVQTKGIKNIRVVYNYYAQQFDAGGSILEDDLLYINFINCSLYVEGRIEESYEIELHIPTTFKIACGLRKDKHTLFANSFYELVDAPLLASQKLQTIDYQIDNTLFHLWFYGKIEPNFEKIHTDFQRFTQEQISIFGEFPEKEYHFLFLIPTQNFYHGVEHFNSTVIVLGSDQNFEKFYESDLLGISSHELFHVWNAIKIRPAELVPYNFTSENYFRTGYVVEGLTTYYGDYLLARSGVWSKELYFFELNNVLKRYFDNFGHLNMSLADSSFDLWLDGYAIGIPNRKVSIYHKGAIAALILDLEIRRLTKNEKSLDTLMLVLWKEFGLKNKGYTEQDYQRLVEEVAGASLNDYFEKYIYGTESIEFALKQALAYVGCELQSTMSEHINEKSFGFQIEVFEGRNFITKIYPNSPADTVLSLKDEIISINGTMSYREMQEAINYETTEIVVSRNGNIKKYALIPDAQTYFNRYEIKIRPDLTNFEKNNLEKWLG